MILVWCICKKKRSGHTYTRQTSNITLKAETMEDSQPGVRFWIIFTFEPNLYCFRNKIRQVTLKNSSYANFNS